MSKTAQQAYFFLGRGLPGLGLPPPTGREVLKVLRQEHTNESGQLGISRALSTTVETNQSHETSRPLSQPSSTQFDTNMDDIRDSLSKFKKDIKHRLGRNKRKGDKLGSGGREEGVGPSSSSPQPESRISTGGGGEQEGDGPKTENENVGESAAAHENRPDRKSTASSSAKLVLHAVRDSADAFGPLKSIAGGLCFILENCEVRYFPRGLSMALTCLQRTKANKQGIESLAPRVKELAELLCDPVSGSDVKERERRTRLER